MAFATGAKLVAVPSVRVLARNAPRDAKTLIIVLDAKRGQIFTARFMREGNNWIETESAHLDDLASMIARAPRPVWLLGEGVPNHQQFIPQGDSEIFVTPAELWQPRAQATAMEGQLMAQAGQFIEPDRLVPLYIRMPEAEEVWNRKHAVSNPSPAPPG